MSKEKGSNPNIEHSSPDNSILKYLFIAALAAGATGLICYLEKQYNKVSLDSALYPSFPIELKNNTPDYHTPIPTGKNEKIISP